MRILFVISTLKNGGAERVCSLIAGEFSNKFDTTLLKFDNSEPFFELNQNIKLINLEKSVDSLGFFGNFKKRFHKIFAIRRMLKNGKFDAVFSFLDSTNFLVLIANFALKNKIIISEHTGFETPKPFWVKILRKILYKRAFSLIVLTKKDCAYYATFVKNTSVIYNPFFIKNTEKNFTKKENLVIFVGRLIPFKNCEMFVKIAANLKNSGYKFIVAGDGKERKNLEALNQNLDANVSFLGEISDIQELYKKAKILVSTSHFEGLGNTLIESICFDCARVATKTSGANELIKDGFDGLLCEINDEKMATSAVLSLIENENLRDKICQNARLKLDEFSLEKIALKWQNLADLT